MGFFSNDDSSSTTNFNTDNSSRDFRAVGDGGSVVLGQGATFVGLDAATARAIGTSQSDGVKFMTQMGTDALRSMGEAVTDVTAKSAANMATAWSHQTDVMGATLAGLTAASRANADAGSVIAQAAMGSNANAGATLAEIAKWGALAVLGWVLARSIIGKKGA